MHSRAKRSSEDAKTDRECAVERISNTQGRLAAAVRPHVYSLPVDIVGLGRRAAGTVAPMYIECGPVDLYCGNDPIPRDPIEPIVSLSRQLYNDTPLPGEKVREWTGWELKVLTWVVYVDRRR
jgi:hypothetical protein